MVDLLEISTRGQGLYEFTSDVERLVHCSSLSEGLCSLLIRHTSASLVIQENADPSARRDLETFFKRLVPEGDPRYTHTLEGEDDMPAHIKSALTASTLSIPFRDGRLMLGTWQGIYLWEHRYGSHSRTVAVHIG